MRVTLSLRMSFILLIAYIPLFGQVDTLVCGDTLRASFDPNLGGSPTDTFFIWLGNCQPQVQFDFTTADVPDAADIFYLDINGNASFAGSMPYFGGNCTGPNYFSNPQTFPPMTAMNPGNCLPGFVEMYGQGLPFQDSLLHRANLPGDFSLSGSAYESARLHLDIPSDIVALKFVVRYNPTQNTILTALWDCTPECCITGIGDTVCVGEPIQLGTEQEALGYLWSGPNGFSSTLQSPLISAATPAMEGWYVVEGAYFLGCMALDSVYVSVREANIQVNPGLGSICPGDSVELLAQGGNAYNWLAAPGLLSSNGNSAWVSPTDTTTYWVIGTDGNGCQDTAEATVWPKEITVSISGTDPSCYNGSNGSVLAYVLNGQGPYQIRLLGGNWQNGLQLTGLSAGTHLIEVRDAAGCTGIVTQTLDQPLPLVASLVTESPTCTDACDGSLLIQASGGSAPYQFWQNGIPADSLISNLCANIYAVEVQDQHGCSFSTSTNLDNPIPLQGSLSLTVPTCANTCDAALSLQASGGTGSYSFWIAGNPVDSLTNDLCAGETSLQIQDSLGCSWDTTVQILAPDPVVVTLSTEPVSCFGRCDGEISWDISGGTAPYTSWLDGVARTQFAENLCAQAYEVRMEDANGCPWLDTIVVEEPAPLEIALTSSSPSCVDRCDGQIDIVPQGGNGGYLFWVNGLSSPHFIQGQCAGDYTIRIQDSLGCETTALTSLDAPIPLSGQIQTKGVGCIGDCEGEAQIDIQGGSAPYQYWINGAPQTDALATGFCAGSYEVEVQDAFGCPWNGQFELAQPEPLFAEVASQPGSCESACDGEALILPFGGGGTYAFFINGVSEQAQVENLCPGSYEILLRDQMGCSWQDSFQVEAGPAFELDILGDQWVSEGKSIELTAQASLPIDRLSWAGICDDNCEAHLSFQPESNQLIRATAWTESGCTASDSLWIEVRQPLTCDGTVFAPNAFTPNGDGLNDFFTLYADEDLHNIRQISRFVVYNQWGNIIFDQSGLRPNQPQRGWDGFAQGAPLQEGNYAWAAEFQLKDGSSFSCSGNVVLLR